MIEYELPTEKRLKLAAGIPIAKGMFHVLPRLSDKFVISLTRKLYGKNQFPAGQEFLEKAISMLGLILRRANPNARRAIINNMFINEGIKGQAIRKAVSQKLGFDIPVLIVVSPTQRCPLRCYGCYAAEEPKDGDLSYERFDRLIEEAKEMGIHFFVITGGEPYVYDHMFDLFEKHSDAYFQTYTSGVTLAEREGDVERLAKLGNVLPCISIEGFEEATDKRRGKGHFQRILKAMRMLKEAGVPFGFSGTVTRENNDELLSEKLIDFYIEQGCLVGYLFQYMPIGRAPVFDLVPTPEQRVRRYERVIELRRKKPILLADFWCDGPLVGGCLAGGRRYLHVNSKGHVEPCVFAQAWDMNIYEHSLLDILKNSRLFKAIRKRQPYSENLLRPCMIIDVPECWREAVEESGATYSYETADIVAKDLREKVERFSKEYASLVDPIWEEKYRDAYQDYIERLKADRKKFEEKRLDS